MDTVVSKFDNYKMLNEHLQPTGTTILRHCRNVKHKVRSVRNLMYLLKTSMGRGRRRITSLAAAMLVSAVLLLWLLQPPLMVGLHMTAQRPDGKHEFAIQSNAVVHRSPLSDIMTLKDSRQNPYVNAEARALLLALARDDSEPPLLPLVNEEDVPHGSTENEAEAPLTATNEKGRETTVPVDNRKYGQLETTVDGKRDSKVQATSHPTEEPLPSRPVDGRRAPPVTTAVTIGEYDLVLNSKAELATSHHVSDLTPPSHAAVASYVLSIDNSNQLRTAMNSIGQTRTRHANEAENTEASSLSTGGVISPKTRETNLPMTPAAFLTSPEAHLLAASLTESARALEASDNVSEVTTYETTATTQPSMDGVATVYIGFSDPAARLGNKMFQYASGLALALRYHRPAVLVHPESVSERMLDDMRRLFRLSPLTVLHKPPPPTASNLVESGWGRYAAARFDSSSTFDKSVYTVGYLQSWKYFEPVADLVRREFTLTAEAKQVSDSFFRSAGLPLPGEGSSSSNSGSDVRPVRVGVHVRRGDMLRLSHLYTVAPAEYLIKAIAHYCDKYATPIYNVSFVFATDDHAWVQDQVASRLPANLVVRYVSLDAGGDMAVLSQCDHSIVTGGTFGWWSAWLAGGDVVYYKDFIRPESPLYSGHDPTDYYPPNWLAMTD